MTPQEAFADYRNEQLRRLWRRYPGEKGNVTLEKVCKAAEERVGKALIRHWQNPAADTRYRLRSAIRALDAAELRHYRWFGAPQQEEDK